MGILDKIKDLQAMRQQGQQLQAQLAQEEITGNSSGSGVVISMDGNQEVKSVAISDSVIADRDTRTKVANAVKEAMADLFKNHKKMLQKKFGSMLE